MTVGDADSRFASAGFVVPSVWSWAQFVDSGELARTLTHACLLAEPRFALAYRLTLVGGTLALAIMAGECAHELAIPTSDSRPTEPLCTLLRAINERLLDTGIHDQLALVQIGRTYRVLIVAPGELAEVRELDYADRCLGERGAARGPMPLPATLATTLRDDQRLDLDGSLLGLVAAFVERIAVFAGLDGVTCEPRYAQDPGVLTFTLAHRPATGGGLQVTVRTRYIPELDVQPILDALNRYMHIENKTRLYRVARLAGPNRIDIARLDKPSALALRRSGDLIEHPARMALRALATAGFELPAMYGEWRHFGLFGLATMLSRLAVLANGTATVAGAIAFDEAAPDDNAITIEWTVNGRAETICYPAELATRKKTQVLPMLLRDVNRMLAATGCAHRFLALSGEPYFYTHRVVLLDREWLATVAFAHDVLPGCLDDDALAQLERVVGAFPVSAPSSEPPRLPRLSEILRPDNIQDNDFKCSSRPYDYIDLIEQIARFARVAVEVSQTIVPDGEEFLLTVSHRGTATTIRMANEKYANVSPILEYLNPLLAAREPVRQLYYFRGGGYSGGLVRATAAEAERLQIAGYIT